MIGLLWAFAGLSCGFLLSGILLKLWYRKRLRIPLLLSQDLRLLSRRLAHEIRNPLNAMNLHVQLLEEELTAMAAPPQSTQRRLQQLQHEIKRLDRILTDYQRYARLPAPEFVECHLDALLDDLLDFIEPETQHRGIKLVREIDKLPVILADPSQIRQGLLNLLLNANQAMPEGGQLTVRATSDGENVRIEIEDTGSGIPEEIQEKVFEPFYSTKEEGTGIGLPMAKYVIEAHGGNIKFRTQPDRGTTFSVSLPCKQ